MANDMSAARNARIKKLQARKARVEKMRVARLARAGKKEAAPTKKAEGKEGEK